MGILYTESSHRGNRREKNLSRILRSPRRPHPTPRTIPDKSGEERPVHHPTYRRTRRKPNDEAAMSFTLHVCAVSLGSSLWPLLPIPPHFFALAQRNGVEPQRNALMGAATGAVRSRPPLPFGRKPQRDKLVRQVGLCPVGKLAGPSQLDAVGCDVGASSPWERRAGPNCSRGGTQKRVSLGLHPVSLRKSKEMGWNWQLGPQTTSQENGAPAPAPSPKSGEECIVHRLVALTRMVETPR